MPAPKRNKNARLRKETGNLATATSEQSLRYTENEASMRLLSKQYARNSRAVSALMSLQEKEIKQAGKQAKSVDELRAQSGELIKIRNVLDGSTREGTEIITRLNKQIDNNTDKIKRQVSAYELTKMNVGNYSASIKEALTQSSLFSGVTARLNALISPLKGIFSAAAQEAGLYGGALLSSNAAISRSTAALRLLRLALISTGVGLLVVAIGVLAAGFAKSQKAMDYFERKLAGLKAGFEVIMDRCIALADSLISAIEDPKKAWEAFTHTLKAGFDFIKDQVFDRLSGGFTIVSNLFVTGVLKMRKAWLEFTGSSKEADKLNEKIRAMELENVRAYEKIAQANEKLIQSAMKAKEAFKDVSHEMDKQAEKAEKLEKISREMDREEIQFEGKQAAIKKQIAEYRLRASDGSLPLKKRQEYLKRVNELEKESLDDEEKQIDRLRFHAAKKADINLKTLEGQKRFAELSKKVRQGITQEDTGLQDDKKHEEFMKAFTAFSDKETELLDKQRQKREQAADKAREASKKKTEDLLRDTQAQNDIYRLSKESTAQSLEERLSLEDEMYQRQQSLLDKKYRAKKISQKEYERDSLKLDIEHKGKKARIAMEHTDKELELFKLRHKSRLDNEKILTKELVEEEERRLDMIYGKEKSALDLKRKNNLISEQDYLIEKQNLDDSLQEEKKKNNERLESDEKRKKETDRANEMETRKLRGEDEFALRLEDNEIKRQADLDKTKKTGAEKLLINKKYDEKAKEIERKKLNARLTMASDTAGALAELLGKETDAGKAAAIAQTTIATYQSAVQAYKSLSNIPVVGHALGAAAAAIATATGLAAVKKIVSTDTSDVQNKAKSLSSQAKVSEGSAYKNPARAARGALITLKGPSHAQGGIDLYDSFGRAVVNAEGDEKVAIINKRASRLLEGLSVLNQSTGGIPLARSVGYAAAGGMISREIRSKQTGLRAEMDTKALKEALSASLKPELFKEAVAEGFDTTKVVLFTDQASRHIKESERVNEIRHV